MTIQNDTSRAVYIADGKTSSFVVPFRFFERQLNVYFDDSAEPLAADDYAASASETASGGEIVFSSAPAAGTKITILRNVELTQLVKFIEGEDFPAADYEYSLDKMIMALQQMKEYLNRALVVAPGTGMTVEEAYELLVSIGKNFELIKEVPQLVEKVRKIYEKMLDSVTGSVTENDDRLVTSDGVWRYIDENGSQKFSNLSVSCGTIVSDSTYGTYPYRADIAVPGAKPEHLPLVVFGLEDAVSGNFAPLAEAKEGAVSIFMKEIPSAETITVPALILQ